ncbi:MAG: dihydrodipicolinate synthase family protein [Christensenellales bacterium]|jgi:4-hydroxy-tetrahydrodipicolinate synthase
MKPFCMAEGVWPTMITPFTDRGEVDLDAMERVVDWYIDQGVDGIFAICQSSEMFDLSTDEQEAILRRVVRAARGRVPVIASGHTSYDRRAQLAAFERLGATGVEALVLITNLLAGPDRSAETFLENMRFFADRLPLPLGLYECPHPYKYVLTPEQLQACAKTGRFYFLKDTCCDAALIRRKLAAVAGTRLKLFNANAQTLLETLRAGAAGYSGVMANFHPALYSQLCAWARQGLGEQAQTQQLQALLCLYAFTESMAYPVTAKYHMNLVGVPMALYTRARPAAELTAYQRGIVEQGVTLERAAMACLKEHSA